MTGLILIGIFVVLLISGLPVALCLGISALVSVLQMDLPAMTLAINSNAALSKMVLEAIPFFILGGNIMEKSGISRKLIDFASALVGHIKGGLIIVCVLCACFFAAISGSGPATVAALGTIIIPAMVSCGYNKETATGLTATAGGIGLIIPPSISYVVIAPLAGVSTGDLFLAGVFPGIVMGAALMLAGLWLNKSNPNIKVLTKASWKERWIAFKDAIWGLLMPVIILGGIYGGIFTATEAAAVSAVSMHCPLLPETRSIINKDSISKMKDGVIILNNSRGQLINERDLADALKSGKICAAAVDVVSTEPISADNPLLSAPNCLITPHISWAPKESRQRIMTGTAENIRAFISGKPINLVN